MEKRKFKFLLGLMTCAFALSALAPIAAEEETASETTEQTTLVHENQTEHNANAEVNKSSYDHEDLYEITSKYGYDYDENYRPASAIVVDAETGQIIYGDNIDLERDPASLTKVMTAYLVFEAVEKGKISLDTKIVATENDRAISTIPDISNNKIVVGIEYPVRELLSLMLYPSSNVATVMLSHAISESEAKYIEMMNNKAKELGMTSTKFYNASGANISSFRGLYNPEGVEDLNNVTTARDLATLTYYFLKNYPKLLEFTKEPAVTTMEGTKVEETFYTLNYMIPGMKHGYFNVDGIKTGSSPTAQLNHLVTAKHGDLRVIEVVMGVGDWWDYITSANYRSQYGNALLEKAYTEFKVETLLKAGEHEIDGQKFKLDKDIQILTKGNQKPTYKLVGDEIVIENLIPVLTQEIRSNVYKVSLISNEITTSEESSNNSSNNSIKVFDGEEDSGTFANWLRSLSKNPLLLAGIILTLSVFISGIVLATVQVFKKKD